MNAKGYLCLAANCLREAVWLLRLLLLVSLAEVLSGCICRPVRLCVGVVRGTERGVRAIIKSPETAGAKILGLETLAREAHSLPPIGYGPSHIFAPLTVPHLGRLVHSLDKPRASSPAKRHRKTSHKPGRRHRKKPAQP